MNPHTERHEKLRWFISAGEDLESRSTFIDAPGASAPTVAGRRIGRYRLLDRLGEGGMGVVFRAADDDLGREVAIKMLKTAQAYSTTEIERFQREARHTARLRHPGIATVYEIGREGDAFYLSLELIDGKPFDPKAGNLHERVALLEKVARAVQYAHEQGVIHRDLKPGNILVDAAGEPHLLDFGLSRDLEAPGQLTRSGAYFGTPAYSSPEQAEGRVRELDARTDVYALGAILYEVLAGDVPFTGNTMAEILKNVTTADARRPAGPPELVTVCLKALEKDPARRYPTAAAFADDLSRFLRGEPVLARPASRTGRIWRAAQRNRTVVLTSLLLAAVTAAWAIREWHRAGDRLVLDDFEQTPQAWKYIGGQEFPGARGSLTVDPTVAHGGRRSYRLEGDFSGGGEYVGGWRDLSVVQGRDLRELRFWVKTSTLARLSIRINDATDQCHQKQIALLPTEDWQELVLKVGDLVGGEHWGGANDGKWHGPPRALGLNLGRNAFAKRGTTKGALWIDDLELALEP